MGQRNDIPNQVRKAAVLIEPNLAKDVKGNTKCFYRYFVTTGKTGENADPLQKEMGNPVTWMWRTLRYSMTFWSQPSVTGAPPTLPELQAGTGETKNRPLGEETRAKTIYGPEGVQGHL